MHSRVQRNTYSAALTLLLASVGCAPRLDSRWVIVEISEPSGVRIHDVQGAHRIAMNTFPCEADLTPSGAWRIPPVNLDLGARFVRILSGDVSEYGELALARRSAYEGVLEIRDIRNGKLLWQRNSCALAVRWSNDGQSLAVFEWDPMGRGDQVGAHPEKTRLVLYGRDGTETIRWSLPFARNGKTSYWDTDCFTIDWDVSGRMLLVGCRKAVRNALVPQTFLVNVTDGPIVSANISDAYFVDRFRLVASEGGRWAGASFYRIIGGRIEKSGPVGRHLFAIEGFAEEHLFLAHSPPACFPALRFSLPVILLDSEGALVAEDVTGYSYGPSLRMLPADSRLARTLLALVNSSASESPLEAPQERDLGLAGSR